MITKDQATCRVCRALDDEDGDVWTKAQIADFVQDGYDHLCREAECLFDMKMYTSQYRTGNYTRDFEKDYLPEGMVDLGRFNFTREWEREFVEPGAIGPVNHTRPVEAEHMTENGNPPSTAYTQRLPDGFVSIDRVTHDWLMLLPESQRYLREYRTRYETETGGVYTYSMDSEGLWTIRMVGVPVGILPTTDYETSGTFGNVRQITSWSYDDEPVIGTYGIIRQVPDHFNSGQYGGIKQIVDDQNSTRVEFFRLGRNLDNEGFEIPDRYVRYVEWWAMYRAFSTPGDGEDKKMAAHFKMRFEAGVQRVKKRIADVMAERTAAMGQKRLGERDSYLERFPSSYGYSRPFRAGRGRGSWR
jgi:hypothetical protein